MKCATVIGTTIEKENDKMMSRLDKLEKGEVKVTSDNPLSATEAKAIATRFKIIATRDSIRKQEVLESPLIIP